MPPAPLPVPYQTRIFEGTTTFANESDGVWQMNDFDGDEILDLAFIKTRNTPSGRVEVHAASGASDFKTRILDAVSSFAVEGDGVWCLADYDGDGIPDLVFIKTGNTPSGRVEVHVASGASNFQTRVLDIATPFRNENDGVWMMAYFADAVRPDLVFIKTSNTTNGFVEVHVASGASLYQTIIFSGPTTFGNESDGTWLLGAPEDYAGGFPDLIFVKTSNTPSGRVEVHFAEGDSQYQERGLETATTFGNETDGTWLMEDYTGDGSPDLIFIKTANTSQGLVEIHIAAG